MRSVFYCCMLETMFDGWEDLKAACKVNELMFADEQQKAIEQPLADANYVKAIDYTTVGGMFAHDHWQHFRHVAKEDRFY